MATTLLIVLAGATVAAVIWLLSVARARNDELRPFELEPTAAPEFAFGPAPVDEDRPPRLLSALRVALFVSVLGGLVAALAWGMGVFIKARLDAYLR
jgi:hypothetical protein